MADFAPNYTARYRLRYSTMGKRHAMTFRKHPGGGSLDLFIAGVDAFLTTLLPKLNADWTLLSADYAGENSDVFLPADMPTLATGGTTTPATGYRPGFISFVGRGALGSPTRLFIYGTAYLPVVSSGAAGDWRITSAEDSVIANAVGDLNTIPDHAAIDRSVPTWYPYVNCGYNGYYQRKMRQG